MHNHILNIIFVLSYTMFINSPCVAQVSDTIVTPIINEIKQDSAVLDSTQNKKNFFNSGATYNAKDTVSINPGTKRITLYNNAKLVYGEMEITSGKIVIDYSKNEIYAGRIKDSSGTLSQSPVFKQGNDIIEPDSIRFNLDSKKALIFNSKTEQSGMNIISEKTKKQNDSVYFMDRALSMK